MCVVSTQVIAVDLGGTHARFSIADVAGGRVVALGDTVVLPTAQHEDFAHAWAEFSRRTGGPLPCDAVIAVAGSAVDGVLRMPNVPWVLRTAELASDLRLQQCLLINDFEAVARAVPHVGDGGVRHVLGPQRPLQDGSVVSVVGPGTGLGVAQLLRRDGQDVVVATEGGHVGFAPQDEDDDLVLRHVRQRVSRVSAERIVSGQGLAHIYEALAHAEGRDAHVRDVPALWTSALSGTDGLAAEALERFLRALGSVAGDIALAQGATSVVIAGGLGLRVADRLHGEAFRTGFLHKGRLSAHMADLSVYVLIHPQPGLLGAATVMAATRA